MGRVNIIFACLFIIFIVKAADQFDITKIGKDGTSLYQTVCNVQTTLEFQFSSETKLPAAGSVKLLLSRQIKINQSCSSSTAMEPILILLSQQHLFNLILIMLKAMGSELNQPYLIKVFFSSYSHKDYMKFMQLYL